VLPELAFLLMVGLDKRGLELEGLLVSLFAENEKGASSF
jgi:hypothetical protein